MAAVYYPGCKVRIQVRFEDYLPTPPAPALPPPTPGFEGFGLGAEHQFPTGPFLSSGFDIIPLECMVERNSYRLADTVKLKIPFSKLPFDPRIIRAMTLQVFGGVHTATSFAESVGTIGSPQLFIPDAIPPDRPFGGLSNELIRGFADTIQLKGTGDDAVLELEGRDLTAILIDNEVPPNAVLDIPGDVPLDILIKQILLGDGIPNSPRRLGLPQARGVVVKNEATRPFSFDPVTGEVFAREPLPPVTDFKGPQWLDSKRSAKRGRKTSPSGAHKVSYWDLITDICVSAGFIVYIRTPNNPNPVPGALLPPPEVVISRPRTYYEGRGQLVPSSGIPVPQRRKYVYGANVEDFDLKKKFAGTHVPVVEVRSYDVVTGLPLFARWPPSAPHVKVANNRPSVTGLADNEEIKVFVLDEVSFGQGTTRVNVAEFLIDAAQSIYEQLGREEQSIRVKTSHCSGFPAFLNEGDVADTFFLQSGDPIEIEFAVHEPIEGQVNILSAFEALDVAGRTEAYVLAGVPPAAAALAATASLSPLIQKQYRTQRIAFNWDHESGWSFDIEAINYLDLRNAAELAAEGTEIEIL